MNITGFSDPRVVGIAVAVAAADSREKQVFRQNPCRNLDGTGNLPVTLSFDLKNNNLSDEIPRGPETRGTESLSFLQISLGRAQISLGRGSPNFSPNVFLRLLI
jgi:hypothetical protein